MLSPSIEDIITSRFFETIGVAILSLVISGIIKIISHNRKHNLEILNEFGVGLEMIITALILLITMSTDYFMLHNRPGIDDVLRKSLNTVFEVSHWEVMGLILILLITSVMVSFLGWKKRNRRHQLWGIFLPDLIGVFSLWYVFNKY
jgi:glycerol uptake facilitator-like aquaporin